MAQEVRREELGKFFLDLAKYVLTVVVVGTLISEVVNLRALLIGLGLGAGLTVIGYWILPPAIRDAKELTSI